jgi:membrane protein implicated in regulation of membrane protease activity
MGILYGFADAAEDIKLASILAHPGDIDMGEAAAANVLTRLKFVTITLSVVGLVVFAILSAIALVAGRAFLQQTNIEKLPGRT